MIPYQEPERAKLLDEKMIWLDSLWLKGQIGDATYLRSLFIAGELPDEANSRLNMLKMEKKDVKNFATRR